MNDYIEGIETKKPRRETGFYRQKEMVFTLCAGPTRLELATSGLTGRRSNQLNYDPKWFLSRAGFSR